MTAHYEKMAMQVLEIERLIEMRKRLAGLQDNANRRLVDIGLNKEDIGWIRLQSGTYAKEILKDYHAEKAQQEKYRKQLFQQGVKIGKAMKSRSKKQ